MRLFKKPVFWIGALVLAGLAYYFRDNLSRWRSYVAAVRAYVSGGGWPFASSGGK